MSVRARVGRAVMGRMVNVSVSLDGPATDTAVRSAEIGNAIQTLVAADPDLSVSVIGMGLDALSSALIHSPDKIRDMGGWIDLIVSIRRYIETGDVDDVTRDLIAGTLDIRAVG